MKFFFLVSIFFLLYSCDKNIPSESAFFIKPSKVSLCVPDSNKQKLGSNSSKISDLWIYVNGQFQGAYPSDHLIPILNKNKNVKINVFAGIKNNGINDTRVFWSMYEKLEFDTLIESGKTIDRAFTFNYNPNTKIAFNETFDNIDFIFKKSDISETTFSLGTSSDSFEGKYLKLELNDSSVIGQIETIQSYSLTQGSENIYLELDYKTNESFSIGLIGDGNPILKSVIVINPQVTWNKIYIQLSSVVSSAPVSNKYKIYFQMLKKNTGVNSRLFLDNVKLVYL